MSYDRDPERYVVEPNDGYWTVHDTYLDEDVAGYRNRDEAFDACSDLNWHFNEAKALEAAEAAIEHYWEAD